MAISSPSSSRFSLSFSASQPQSSLSFPFSRPFTISSRPNRCFISSNIHSSNQSDSNDSSACNFGYEYQYKVWERPKKRKGVSVYVMIPVDSVDFEGEVKMRKALSFSLKTLAKAGVEGIVMDIWWGMVEKEEMTYNWRGYLDIIRMAREFGLKVKVVLAFHEFGVSGDKCWIPLPYWVRKEMVNNPDLAYTDRFHRRSYEYISLGCDTLPVLNGRSPIHVYSDFMRSFRDVFENFLGFTITGIQVGMGPAGELRYPSCPSKKLAGSWRVRELGEFQCYDKHMIASLNACSQEIGMPDWGMEGPFNAWNLMHNPDQTEFFKSDGFWNTPYGRFFLEWYSGMLLLHGEKLCMAAETIFCRTGVTISAKLAGIPWHYDTDSHASELTAGYYNTSIRDGYLPIARMFGRHGVTLCCNCFDMRDSEEKPFNPLSSPERLLRQILLAARVSDLPIEGENFSGRLDDESLKQVLKTSKFNSDVLDERISSFNFARMSKNFFNPQHLVRFIGFVKQMSHGGSFQAKLEYGGGESCISSASGTVKVGAAHSYY